MSAAKRAMDARRRNTMETVMALEIKGDTASVDDGGGTLTLLDQGPYGPQHGVIAISAVRIQGELRRGRAHDIESSEVLRLAMFLLETQSREHVPLHPSQRRPAGGGHRRVARGDGAAIAGVPRQRVPRPRCGPRRVGPDAEAGRARALTRSVVRAGELDAQLAAAAQERSKAFKRRNGATKAA